MVLHRFATNTTQKDSPDNGPLRQETPRIIPNTSQQNPWEKKPSIKTTELFLNTIQRHAHATPLSKQTMHTMFICFATKGFQGEETE